MCLFLECPSLPLPPPMNELPLSLISLLLKPTESQSKSGDESSPQGLQSTKKVVEGSSPLEMLSYWSWGWVVAVYTLTNASSQQTSLNPGSRILSCKQSKHTQSELAPGSKGSWSLNSPSFFQTCFRLLALPPSEHQMFLGCSVCLKKINIMHLLSSFHHYLSEHHSWECAELPAKAGNLEKLFDISYCIDSHPTKWEGLLMLSGLSWKL